MKLPTFKKIQNYRSLCKLLKIVLLKVFIMVRSLSVIYCEVFFGFFIGSPEEVYFAFKHSVTNVIPIRQSVFSVIL